MTLSLWYGASDRFAVSVSSPGASYGPYAAPANNSYDAQTTADFRYGHNGSVYYDNTWRLIYLTVNGPVGNYTLNLSGTQIGNAAGAGQLRIWFGSPYQGLVPSGW